MKQDPEYLRSQSRYVHRIYRRNWRFARCFVLCWFLFFFGRFAVAAADVVGGFGWGLGRKDIWDSLALLAFGGGLWLLTSLINRVLLAYVRDTYGLELAED